jgi:hypothetical protein
MARVFKSGEFVKLSISIDDDTTLEIPLRTFGQKLTDFRRFWKDFYAPQFFRDIARNFRSEGQPVGGWRALNPVYAAWKRSVVGNKPILVFSGAMRESFTLGGRSNVFRANKDHVYMGSKLKRAGWHHRGMGRLPRRQILWIGPRRIYQPLLDRFVAEELRAAGMPNVTGGR